MADRDLQDFPRWQYRPRRKIVKPCLDYSQVLLREEEQALKKALYVSLRDAKLVNGVSLGTVKSRVVNSPNSSVSVSSKLAESNSKKKLKRRKYKKCSELGDGDESPKDVVKWSSGMMNHGNANASAAFPSTINSLGTALCKAFGDPKKLDISDATVMGSTSKRIRRRLRVQRKFANLQPCSPHRQVKG